MHSIGRKLNLALWGVAGWLLGAASAAPVHAKSVDDALDVSYHKQVRPILQTHCHGCHQPAKAKGKYEMTAFEGLVKGGSSGDAAIVPGKPAQSALVSLITPHKGVAEMPKDAPALSEPDRALITRWIEQGARDDTPANARQRFDADHPPIYQRPPVIQSLDYSPDGKTLAVAAFHEVLLVSADGATLQARLVGISESITSVRFSPDGARLAVTGGLPGRMGEVQVWDVASRKLQLSVPVTFDTLYGADWSPDGRLISFGCSDQSARAIDAKTGQVVFRQSAHEDWALGTAFSKDGSHLISVGRDMTAKLSEVATQRFIDNITSITPGALKGGLAAVVRHPERDEIVVGGSDGTPKVYRVFRTSARKIGDDANLIRNLPALRGRVFGLAMSRDGKRVAAAASLDRAGQVFISAYTLEPKDVQRIKAIEAKRLADRSPAEKKELEALKNAQPSEVVRTEVPDSAMYAVAFHPDGATVAAAGADGRVRLIDAGTGEVRATFSPAPIAAPTSSVSAEAHPDYIRDVGPVLSRLGCNAGTCHGSAKGKNGFKLSLRGYDPTFDLRALTDDHASRRVNVASPDDSLMLLKATGAVPHEGGALTRTDHPYYAVIRNWIAGGAKLDLATPRVVAIELTPKDPTLDKAGQKLPMRVSARYADGRTRDVTGEAFIESGNPDVAAADRDGVVTAIRRGEAPVLARYEGAYAVSTLLVMGERPGFVWKQPESWGQIDDLVAAKWERVQVLPSELTTDLEFVRRVYLDLTGLPPTPEQVKAFTADARPTRVKRDALIDQLVGGEAYIDHWSNKWADLLQVNGKFLGGAGAAKFRKWVRDEVAANTPYDQFARKVLTAKGSNREQPEASYFKILREPAEIMENTTHLFLGVRFNCNKCHDHPFERWTQDQYYETAAFFARVGLKPDPASGKDTIGGTAVEGAKPLYEIVEDRGAGEITHDRTKSVTPPKFPFDAGVKPQPEASRRDQAAAWITSPDNPYFARSYVNRVWAYLMGVGLIEPIDDIRAGNPPTNPALLDHLAKAFVASGFDTRSLVRTICKSRTYQLSFRANEWNKDDRLNYAKAMPRRLSAEALYDAVYAVTGATSRIPGVPAGTRAAALPDAGINLPDGFLATFGRPVRESACECERSSSVHLGSVMALVSGPTIAEAVGDPNNAIARLVASEPDDARLVDAVFMRVLNRPATEAEVARTLALLREVDEDHEDVIAQRKRHEELQAPVIARLEGERQAAMQRTLADLEAHQRAIAPAVAQKEQQRKELVAQLETKLKAFEATIPSLLPQWEADLKAGPRWAQLAPTQMKSSNGAKLELESDGAVWVTGPQGLTQYELTAPAPIGSVTAIRLEALADDRLPGKGPGRAPNGNFVLSELEVYAAPAGQPDKFTRLSFASAAAAFSQENYPVASAVDGKAPAQSNGWAIHPKMGESHTAIFILASPLAGEGHTLRFVLNQQYQDGQHALGRFRLSITSSANPSELPAGPTAVFSPWHHVGPFKGTDNNNAFNRAFPPEQKVNLKATYENGSLKWVARPEWIDAQVHNVFEAENAANYLHRTVTVPGPVKLPLSLGSDDGIKVFLNGKQVLANNVGRGAAPDQERITLDLKSGVNHLLLKIVNGGGASGFYFRSELTGPVIPPAVLAALDVPAAQRSPEQVDVIARQFRATAPEAVALDAQLAMARKPLPEDPGLTQRKQAYAQASMPIPLDPDLVEWRRLANVSEAQHKNKRLTLAQDLTWALINSPAFLFNH